jgi:CIC family chloride channel protein
MLDDIRNIMFEQKLYKKMKAHSLMQIAPAIIDYDKDSMETIMEKFKETVAWNLPVIKDGKYYGFISKSRLLTSYRRKLINVTA